MFRPFKSLKVRYLGPERLLTFISVDIFSALIEYHPKKNTKIVQFISSLWLYLAVLLARWGGGGSLAEEGGHAAAVDWVQTLAGTSPGETHGYMGQTQTLGGHISKSQARSLSQTWVRSCQYVTDITGGSMLWYSVNLCSSFGTDWTNTTQGLISFELEQL